MLFIINDKPAFQNKHCFYIFRPLCWHCPVSRNVSTSRERHWSDWGQTSGKGSQKQHHTAGHPPALYASAVLWPHGCTLAARTRARGHAPTSFLNHLRLRLCLQQHGFGQRLYLETRPLVKGCASKQPLAHKGCV